MFGGARVLVGPETGELVSSALERYVREHSPLAPTIEGRVTIR
jgi:hypothetical protein